MKKRSLFVVALFLLLMPFAVRAEVMEVGDKVNVTGEHDSSKMIFGNDVTVSAEIDGIAEVFGNTVNTNGKVSYGIYFGNQVNVGDEVEKDAILFGNIIKVNSNAVLSRDVSIFANVLELKTDIGRDAMIVAEKVDLRGVSVGGNLYVTASEIVLDEETNILGTFSYYEDAKVVGLDKASIHETVTLVNTGHEYSTSYLVKKWFKNLAMNVVSLLVILLVFPKIKKTMDEYNFEAGKIIFTGAIGFLSLILVPVVALIALICEYTLPLSIILLALYFMAMYVGWVYASYVIGKKVWSLSKQKENVFIEGILGLFITELVVLIPKVGGLIGFLLFIFGMGLFLYQFKKISFLGKNTTKKA